VSSVDRRKRLPGLKKIVFGANFAQNWAHYFDCDVTHYKADQKSFFMELKYSSEMDLDLLLRHLNDAGDPLNPSDETFLQISQPVITLFLD
jgi:hypothetical protein